ncbi:hypothetical protein K469DRAFT_155540 [Zopfia rhizophila CBS 207.26]|uniref:Uncharacterized protein n=1 Tax=Zopfia rhizophila CBS 207.26 TaxID=1314779 RepID=A0A6A6E4N8_9PEZI|nr:hypothetical protein K469DRAFT_155540 [Zopfia rhizophila CBS 207.26]
MLPGYQPMFSQHPLPILHRTSLHSPDNPQCPLNSQVPKDHPLVHPLPNPPPQSPSSDSSDAVEEDKDDQEDDNPDMDVGTCWNRNGPLIYTGLEPNGVECRALGTELTYLFNSRAKSY